LRLNRFYYFIRPGRDIYFIGGLDKGIYLWYNLIGDKEGI